jgi:hypothetical protein
MNKDDYIKKLEKRIHNQRVALRENWEIVEMRKKEEAAPIYRSKRPIKNKWFDYVMKQSKEIRRLKVKCGEI